MAELLRRTDLADRDILNRAVKRAATQAIRDAGDGGTGGAVATWGFINGTLSNQDDLKARTDDLEALAFLEGA